MTSTQILIESTGRVVGGALGDSTISNYVFRRCLVLASLDIEFDPLPARELITQTVVECAFSVGADWGAQDS